MKPKGLITFVCVLLCLLLSGCNGNSLTQFANFAAAGTAYVTAAHGFFEEAGSAFVSASSATLAGVRPGADGDAAAVARSRAFLIQQDRDATAYLGSLREIDLHAALLGKYFAAITDITGGKASKDAAAQVSGLGDAIGGLNPKIGSMKISGSDLKSGLTPATNLAMSRFELKALNDEVAKHGKTIDEALELQERAVTAIAEQMRGNVQATLEEEEQARIVAPYVAGGLLPRRWQDDREAYLRRTAALESAEAAQKAIKHLHEAYRQLISNRDAKIDLHSLMECIGDMAGYASAAQGTSK